MSSKLLTCRRVAKRNFRLTQFYFWSLDQKSPLLYPVNGKSYRLTTVVSKRPTAPLRNLPVVTSQCRELGTPKSGENVGQSAISIEKSSRMPPILPSPISQCKIVTSFDLIPFLRAHPRRLLDRRKPPIVGIVIETLFFSSAFQSNFQFFAKNPYRNPLILGASDLGTELCDLGTSFPLFFYF